MPSYLVRAVLPYLSGLPEDVSVQDWVINDTTDAPIGPIVLAFESFYNDNQPDGNSIASAISTRVTREVDGCRFEAYLIDLATGAVGSPFGVYPFTLGATTSTASLPDEVALCTSFASVVPPGGRPGRHRGRIYMGPFVSGFNTADGRPSDILVERLVAATNQLALDLIDAGVALSVWSRVDKATRPVVRGWVDNAWDTQRRRGVAATGRVTWALS